MYKGAPIIRSALTGEPRLELTYRHPLVPERAGELRNDNQQQDELTTSRRRAAEHRANSEAFVANICL
jgi:hypothetical protein